LDYNISSYSALMHDTNSASSANVAYNEFWQMAIQHVRSPYRTLFVPTRHMSLDDVRPLSRSDGISALHRPSAHYCLTHWQPSFADFYGRLRLPLGVWTNCPDCPRLHSKRVSLTGIVMVLLSRGSDIPWRSITWLVWALGHRSLDSHLDAFKRGLEQIAAC